MRTGFKEVYEVFRIMVDGYGGNPEDLEMFDGADYIIYQGKKYSIKNYSMVDTMELIISLVKRTNKQLPLED